MWIRQVLVPGFTDDENDLIKLRDFISSLKSVQKVEFLPYHKMGVQKYQKLGISYPLEGTPELTEDEIQYPKGL